MAALLGALGLARRPSRLAFEEPVEVALRHQLAQKLDTSACQLESDRVLADTDMVGKRSAALPGNSGLARLYPEHGRQQVRSDRSTCLPTAKNQQARTTWGSICQFSNPWPDFRA